jgi:predicted RNase H-like nuclease
MTMSKTSRQEWLAGVDGCPGEHWIAAFIRTSGELGERRVFSRFADILDAPEKPSIIAVDVPIGLPECGGREAESAVRPMLGRLKRSVFPIPTRRAIFAELGPFEDQQARYAAHQRACAVAAATSKPSERITIQAFGLFQKIREVDALLRSNARLKDAFTRHIPSWRSANSMASAHLMRQRRWRAVLMRRGLRCAAGCSRMSDFPPRSSKPPRPVGLAQTICSTRSRAHVLRDGSH